MVAVARPLAPPNDGRSARGSGVQAHLAAPLDTDVALETPEHVVFRYRVAGPALRTAAHLIDLLLLLTGTFLFGLVLVGIALLLGIGNDSQLASAMVGVILVFLFFVQWLYFAICESWKGTTPGKAVLGLRVVTKEGRPIGFGAAALRNLLRAVDMFPGVFVVGLYLPAFAAMAITGRFQRLGDLLAGTMVVVPERTTNVQTIRLHPAIQPGERAALPEQIRLSPEELRVLELFLRRRGRLGVAREQELARVLTPVFAARFQVPQVVDPVRFLSVIYDIASRAGRDEAPAIASEIGGNGVAGGRVAGDGGPDSRGLS
jgi:uncharacterized RDD family membrane protein YckC